MKSTLAHRTERVPEQPEKAAQGRLLCRPEPNAGKRRMKPEAEIREKKSRSLNFPSPQKSVGHMILLKIMCPEVQGTLPCREIFKRQAAS